MLRKALLACGVLSSLLYVAADLLAAVRFPGYHDFFSQAVSELTAIGAPTRGLVAPLLTAYDVAADRRRPAGGGRRGWSGGVPARVAVLAAALLRPSVATARAPGGAEIPGALGVVR